MVNQRANIVLNVTPNLLRQKTFVYYSQKWAFSYIYNVYIVVIFPDLADAPYRRIHRLFSFVLAELYVHT